MFIKTLQYIFGKAKSIFEYFPIILILFGYVIGIVVGEWLNLNFKYPVFVLIMGVIVAIVSAWISERKASRLLLLIAAVIIGLGRIFYSNCQIENLIIQSKGILLNEDVEIEAVVKEVGYSDGNTNLTISDINRWPCYSGSAKLKVSGKVKDIVENDKIALCASFEIPENYNEFDYVRYLERRNILLIGDGFDVRKIGAQSGLMNSIGHFRNNIIQKTRRIIPEPESSLLLGLTIGYRADFDESFEAALRKTGTTHIVAVSGYNVTLMVALVVGLCAPLGKKSSYVPGFIFLIFFCFLTGFNVPVLRASLMFFIMWFAKNLGRECSAFLGLSIASIIILFTNPFVLWDISFQLSFLSTTGLIMGGIFNVFDDYDGFWNFAKDSLLSTIWAFIITLPVIVFNFSSFTFLTFISNLLVLPLVNITTILGIAFIVGVLVNGYIGWGIAYVLWPVLYLIYKIIDWVACFPFGVINYECNLIHVFVYYISLVFIVCYFCVKKESRNLKYG